MTTLYAIPIRRTTRSNLQGKAAGLKFSRFQALRIADQTDTYSGTVKRQHLYLVANFTACFTIKWMVATSMSHRSESLVSDVSQVSPCNQWCPTLRMDFVGIASARGWEILSDEASTLRLWPPPKVMVDKEARVSDLSLVPR